MPGIAHLLYISIVLLIGALIGYRFGQRAARDAEAAHAHAEEAKARRRAERAEHDRAAREG